MGCAEMKALRKSLRAVEIALAATAIVLLGVYAGATIGGWVSGKNALRRFEVAKANADRRDERPPSHPSWPTQVDFALWSEKRRLAYIETLSQPVDEPMAVLTVPRFNIRGAVLEGTDEFALNRGFGWIAGTAKPGQHGNVGIAGHRDGFFRALKDIG